MHYMTYVTGFTELHFFMYISSMNKVNINCISFWGGNVQPLIKCFLFVRFENIIKDQI